MDYNKIKNTCIFAEKLGYYGFYYGESLTDLDLDCWNRFVFTLIFDLKDKIGLLLPKYRIIAK
jgi:hypothetical protein